MHVKSCHDCQVSKTSFKKKQGQLICRYEDIIHGKLNTDILGPVTQSYNQILICVDAASRFLYISS